jgi:prophage maintenance system killer protein
LRAATVFESLSASRPLAAMAAAFWLEQEGYRLSSTGQELVETALGVARGRMSVEQLAAWLETRSYKVD